MIRTPDIYLTELANILYNNVLPRRVITLHGSYPKLNWSRIAELIDVNGSDFQDLLQKPIKHTVSILQRCLNTKVDLLLLPSIILPPLYTSYIRECYKWHQKAFTSYRLKKLLRLTRPDWMIYKHEKMSMFNVVPKQMHTVHKLFIMIHSAEDRKETSELINTIYKGITSWINPEGAAELEKKKDARVNVDYERQVQEMREGTFGKEELQPIELGSNM